MSISFDRTLSADQEAAVRSDARAIVVVASAGSGKTEVVARRVERLLGESPGESFRVLALSYTVKAAEELAQRFRDRLGSLHQRVDTNTIHGFAHGLLRQHGTRIGLPVEVEVLVRDEDRAELLSRWLLAEGKRIPEDLAAVFRELDIGRARQQPSEMLQDWEAALASIEALDYGSMLVRATELLQLPSTRRQLGRLYAHVLVDEGQNLTLAQYSLLTTLIGPPEDSQHLPAMLVGDDKQSIVSFAGGDPALIKRFETEYNAVRFDLRENFRSAAAIVHLGEVVAQRLGYIQPNANQHYAAAGMVTVNESRDEEEEGHFVAAWALQLLSDGIPPQALSPGENPQIKPVDIAILARSAAALRRVRGALQAAGHEPAVSSTAEEWLGSLAGKVLLELMALRSASDHQSTHWELARLLNVSELEVGSPDALAGILVGHDDPLLQQVGRLCSVSTPAELITSVAGISVPERSQSASIAAWDADCAQLIDTWKSFAEQTAVAEQTWGNLRLRIARQQRGDVLDDGIRLLTVHKAQGREYRAVAVVGLNEGQFPDFRATSPEERLAELRTFYVAVTRPSRMLMLSRAAVRPTRYGPRSAEPSKFLQLLVGAATTRLRQS